MRKLTAALGLCLVLCASGAGAQDASTLKWQRGPGTGVIDGRASIDIPDGYAFLDAAETKKLMELSHNLSDGNEYFFAPKTDAWEAYFSFNEEGYIKDDDKLDPDAMLQTLRDQQAQANEQRKQRGWPSLTVVGWQIPPRYNPMTKVLEWALLIKDDETGKTTVNYNTRVLGRKGTTSVVVVADPEDFNAGLVAFQERLGGFRYNEGERYADYRAGDRVAEYGLAALVTGGAAAVAAKKGVFAVIGTFLAAAWKFVLAGFAAAAAWLRSLFRKKEA